MEKGIWQRDQLGLQSEVGKAKGKPAKNLESITTSVASPPRLDSNTHSDEDLR